MQVRIFNNLITYNLLFQTGLVESNFNKRNGSFHNNKKMDKEIKPIKGTVHKKPTENKI